MNDLARKLVACPKWRWMAGCRVVLIPVPGQTPTNGIRGTVTAYESPVRGRVSVAWDGGTYDCRTEPAALVPDLTGPATIGCLLAMLGVATDHDLTATTVYDGSWQVSDVHLMAEYDAPTLGEAVAMALLVAWGP